MGNRFSFQSAATQKENNRKEIQKEESPIQIPFAFEASRISEMNKPIYEAEQARLKLEEDKRNQEIQRQQFEYDKKLFLDKIKSAMERGDKKCDFCTSPWTKENLDKIVPLAGSLKYKSSPIFKKEMMIRDGWGTFGVEVNCTTFSWDVKDEKYNATPSISEEKVERKRNREEMTFL